MQRPHAARRAVDAHDSAPEEGTQIHFQSPDTARLAGIATAPVVETASPPGLDMVARIAYDATHVARVNARAEGVVRSIQVDIGSRVRAGTPLATIESAGVGADQSRLRAAQARLHVAEVEYGRTKDLLDRGLVASKDVLVAQQELEVAQAELESTRRALHVVGGEANDGTYVLAAPLAGVVTQRNISIGTLVDREEMLFEIVDPASMWAEIDVAKRIWCGCASASR
jgi:cobalt-zinc-cadmium efflux system membrane fusion protein